MKFHQNHFHLMRRRFTKLFRTLIGSFTKTSPEMQTSLKTYQLKAGHHFTIGLEFHQMQTRRLGTKHQSKTVIWSQVKKLSEELIEDFTMTSPQMQTRLKKYQLRTGHQITKRLKYHQMHTRLLDTLNLINHPLL